MYKSMNILHHEHAIFRNDRGERSIFDHVHFFEAIDQHNTELAEPPVRRRTLGLAMQAETIFTT